MADVQAELAAERLLKHEELKAFAKHSADVTELHLLDLPLSLNGFFDARIGDQPEKGNQEI